MTRLLISLLLLSGCLIGADHPVTEKERQEYCSSFAQIESELNRLGQEIQSTGFKAIDLSSQCSNQGAAQFENHVQVVIDEWVEKARIEFKKRKADADRFRDLLEQATTGLTQIQAALKTTQPEKRNDGPREVTKMENDLKVLKEQVKSLQGKANDESKGLSFTRVDLSIVLAFLSLIVGPMVTLWLFRHYGLLSSN